MDREVGGERGVRRQREWRGGREGSGREAEREKIRGGGRRVTANGGGLVFLNSD